MSKALGQLWATIVCVCVTVSPSSQLPVRQHTLYETTRSNVDTMHPPSTLADIGARMLFRWRCFSSTATELSEWDRTKALEAKHTRTCNSIVSILYDMFHQKMVATGCNNIAIVKAFQKQETVKNNCQMKG